MSPPGRFDKKPLSLSDEPSSPPNIPALYRSTVVYPRCFWDQPSNIDVRKGGKERIMSRQ
jgi:hypothetical protein